MLIDTHLHLIDKKALNYPWLASAPALDRDYLFKTYRQEAERCGISAALHMEADAAADLMQAETDYIQKTAQESGNFIKGALVSCRPEDENFPDYLQQQQSNSFVKGFRRVLHVMPDALSEQSLFKENIKRIQGTGLTFDLCVLPHQIGKAAALADLAPDLTFILDHCGIPDIKSGAPDSWKKSITELSKRSNVVAKISGVVAYCDADSWNVVTLRPYAEQVIGAFGWDRVVWGSDWPVCTLASPAGGGLSAWVAATHALLDGCSEDEKAKLLAENARRLWRL